jgi:hypothetical protein
MIALPISPKVGTVVVLPKKARDSGDRHFTTAIKKAINEQLSEYHRNWVDAVLKT